MCRDREKIYWKEFGHVIMLDKKVRLGSFIDVDIVVVAH